MFRRHNRAPKKLRKSSIMDASLLVAVSSFVLIMSIPPIANAIHFMLTGYGQELARRSAADGDFGYLLLAVIAFFAGDHLTRSDEQTDDEPAGSVPGKEEDAPRTARTQVLDIALLVSVIALLLPMLVLVMAGSARYLIHGELAGADLAQHALADGDFGYLLLAVIAFFAGDHQATRREVEWRKKADKGKTVEQKPSSYDTVGPDDVEVDSGELESVVTGATEHGESFFGGRRTQAAQLGGPVYGRLAHLSTFVQVSCPLQRCNYTHVSRRSSDSI